MGACDVVRRRVREGGDGVGRVIALTERSPVAQVVRPRRQVVRHRRRKWVRPPAAATTELDIKED